MPLFLDHHRGHTVSPEQTRAMVIDDQVGDSCAEHVRALGHWAGNGGVYCLLEAPDAGSASRYHAQRQLPSRGLRPIDVGVRATGERLTRDQLLLVSRLISELWA